MQQVLDKTPPEWESQVGPTEVFQVVRGTAEWNRIKQKFKVTMPISQIVTITRIQNTWLWGKYCNYKKMLESQHGKNTIYEMELFHGTGENDPKLIYEGEHGFNYNMKKKHMHSSGQATFFARDASYADTYSFKTPDGSKQIFLAKVLASNTYKCDSNLGASTAASNTQSSQLDFEAFIGGASPGSLQVFMTYDNNKAYPAYLINYS